DAATTLRQLVKDGVQTGELMTALGMAALLIPPADLPAEGAPERDVINRVGKAEALAAQKNFDPAKQAFAPLVNGYPEYPNLHFAFGRLLLEMHETDEAVKE